MPKGIDFRIKGLSFEQAGKRLAAAKPPQAPKPGKNPPKRRKAKAL